MDRWVGCPPVGLVVNRVWSGVGGLREGEEGGCHFVGESRKLCPTSQLRHTALVASATLPVLTGFILSLSDRKSAVHRGTWDPHPIKTGSNPAPLCDITSGFFLYGALGSHPFFPSHAVSGCCVLPAAVACAPAGVVSAFADPRGWCAGAVLVAAGAVCTLAVPSSWCTGVVLVAAGVV